MMLLICSTQYARPQRDGPPLRATALIGYSNWLIKNGNTSYVQQKVWPVIKLDLDYTASNWNYTGYVPHLLVKCFSSSTIL
jgi:glucoamylase